MKSDQELLKPGALSFDEKLEFEVSKIIFKGNEGFVVLSGIDQSSKKECVVVGKLQGVTVASTLSLVGKWMDSLKFGKQFKAKDCITRLPTEVIGIEKFLGQSFAKGVGEATAKKIVALFGEKTLSVLDNDPKQLLSISGINDSKLQSILEAWNEMKEYSTVIVPLMNLGISKNLSNKIYLKYKTEAFNRVRSNPYILIQDLWGIGFLKADEIAITLGLEKDSFNRISSAINHVLKNNLDSGSLYLGMADLLKKTVELINLSENENPESLVCEIIDEMIQKSALVSLEHSGATLVSFYKIFAAEEELAGLILRLVNLELARFPFDIANIQRELSVPTQSNMVLLSDQQQKAIFTALANKITIITGGPGTGKTTLLKELIKILKDHKYSFSLSAPTGRAAKRMQQATNCFSQTLHRLLEFDPILKQFGRNINKPLDSDFLIIDEFSMVDLFLANSILRAVNTCKTQILFIGDVDQLPSVGPGKILGDLINSTIIPTVKLTNIFRQEESSLITENAHRINNSTFPISSGEGFKKDFFFYKKEEAHEFLDFLKKFYKNGHRSLGILPEDTIVLTPMHRGIVGSIQINCQLQELLNGSSAEFILAGDGKFKVGDPVMQKKNNYDKAVFNGDIGKIIMIKRVGDQCELIVNFDGKTVGYNIPSELSELTLAYAISIHKSQGSEFPAVIIPLFMQHFMMLNKNVLYTATTRAKRFCFLVGQTKAIAISVKNCQPDDRVTMLKRFLVEQNVEPAKTSVLF